MKHLFLVGGLMALSAGALVGQESELQALKKALQDQQQIIQSLMQKVEALEKQQIRTTNDPALRPTVAVTPGTNVGSALPAAPVSKAWSPTDPIRLGSAQNYIGVSFDALFSAGTSTARDVESLQPGGHDPKQRGFTVQNLETTFEGKVDPYFRGQANIVLNIDPEGETVIEAEEAYLESTSLPWNLQLKAGQYFTEFGRLNATHPHGWAFVDQPLVNNRFLGGDGLRNPGARLSWLVPTPFYSELFFGVQNSQGETATSFRSSGRHGEEEEALPLALRHPDNDRGVRQVEDMLFAPRYAVSFDLTESQTALLGASGLFGPNSSGQEGRTHTEIYGVDVLWKWKSLSHSGGFPFVSWQTEAMVRRFRAGAFDWDENGNGVADAGELVDLRTGAPASLRAETLTDYGVYSQMLYGFRKGWVAGLRGDYVWGEKGRYENFAKSIDGGPAFATDPTRDSRWRVSPNLTWQPTEFSKFRLQYNFDRRSNLGDDHSLWLQFEFLLGAHAAHKF